MTVSMSLFVGGSNEADIRIPDSLHLNKNYSLIMTITDVIFKDVQIIHNLEFAGKCCLLQGY